MTEGIMSRKQERKREKRDERGEARHGREGSKNVGKEVRKDEANSSKDKEGN